MKLITNPKAGSHTALTANVSARFVTNERDASKGVSAYRWVCSCQGQINRGRFLFPGPDVAAMGRSVRGDIFAIALSNTTAPYIAGKR